MSEITAGTEAKTTLPPLLLNHGQIWARVQPGSLALLRSEQQYQARSSLPCAVFQIPKQWSVVCWLTDTLTTSFLEHFRHSRGLAEDIFEKLIKAMVQFYQESQSPQMVKSQVLSLLTRLIRKLRFIRKHDGGAGRQLDGEQARSLTQEAHLRQLFVHDGFIRAILEDIDTVKRQEEKTMQASEAGAKQMLYSSYIQDSLEFLMTIVIPIDKQSRLNSYKDLLSIKAEHLGELREWLDPLMKTSLFMHFFNNELHSLPLDLLQEIHDQTKLQSYQAVDHVLVIDRVPRGEARFPEAWLRRQVVELCQKHHARILNPEKDIHFEKDEYEVLPTAGGDAARHTKESYKLVVLLDGWDHMHPLPDLEEHFRQRGELFKGYAAVTSADYRQFVDLAESDSDDEGSASAVKEAEEQKRQQEEEKKQLEEEVKPADWNCEICTFINPMSDAACGICGQGRRPSMEQLMAAARAQRLEEAKQKAAGAQEGTVVVVPQSEGESPVPDESSLRLKFLARDLRRFVKLEQKRLAQLQEAENLARLRKL